MAFATVILSPGHLPLLEQLLDIYQEAFCLTAFVKPPVGHLRTLLEDPALVLMVTKEDESVVGGLTAYRLPSLYFPYPVLYLYDLAVRPAWRGRGIGSGLLRELSVYATREGIKEIFVQADRPDKQAINFYRKNGGNPEDVIQFTFVSTGPKENP